MKTTLDIPEALLRRMKSLAALRGKSMRDLFIEAAQEKLRGEEASQAGRRRGWRAVFGQAPKGAVSEVQARIEREFESVNPDDWR